VFDVARVLENNIKGPTYIYTLWIMFQQRVCMEVLCQYSFSKRVLHPMKTIGIIWLWYVDYEWHSMNI